MYSIQTEQIHSAINEACSKSVLTVDAAVSMLSDYENTPKDDELKLLIELGFTAHPRVELHNATLNRLKTVKNRAVMYNELLEHYKGYRPVHHEYIESICYDYSLHKGTFDRFKEAIPLCNLQRIATFRREYPDVRLYILAPYDMFTHQVGTSDDPIVIADVGHYYIIITMWGKEQTIPELQQQSLN